MKEFFRAVICVFALQSYDFSNYANLVFGKVNHFSTVFCGITVFSASSSLQFFLLFCIAHFVQNPRFHRRKAIMLGRQNLIFSQVGALLSKTFRLSKRGNASRRVGEVCRDLFV